MGWAKLPTFHMHDVLAFLTSLVEETSEIAGPIIQWSAARREKQNSEIRKREWKQSNITDKVVVITGASSGIGKSTAKLLAEHGAKLYSERAVRTDRRSGSRDLCHRRQGHRILQPM